MLNKSNRDRLLEIFFNDPLPETPFQLRELSRSIHLAPKSVKTYLKELEKEKLIVQKMHRIQGYPVYMPNRDDDYFKFLKIQHTLLKIRESGLLEYLEDACIPDAIALFGSASKGEDIAGSDIDLFVQSPEKKLDLKKYEIRLYRKISVFFSDSFNKLSRELRNNIINGKILKGYLKVC